MEHWIRIPPNARRLVLAWQAPDEAGDRFRWAVGIVEPEGGDAASLQLRYLQGAEFQALNQGRTSAQLRALGFQGYPVFSPRREIHRRGVKEAFMRRVPSPSRSDFQEYRSQFGLPSDVDTTDLTLLGITEAKLPGDGFSLVDPLDPGRDACDLIVEVAGYRYYASESGPLRVGCPVHLEAEPSNPKDPGAVRFSVAGKTIGYINRLQAPTYLSWLQERKIAAFLHKLNGSEQRPRAMIFVQVRPQTSRVAA